MLRIHLFGQLRLFTDELPIKFPGLPKTVPLWVYLLLKRAQPMHRELVAYTLWPDVGESEARRNLRRYVHDLRHALPEAAAARPWLLVDADTIQWNPEAEYLLDVQAFEESSGQPACLAKAADLYAGDLMSTLDTEWISCDRERLRHRFLEVLRQLIEQNRLQGNLAQAITYAQRLLQHDPLREDMVRLLMMLRHESGDRTGALQEYQRFERRLRAEIDVAPMLETSTLYNSIARDSVAPAQPVIAQNVQPTVRVPAPATAHDPLLPPHNLSAQLTTFIGRERELASLVGLLTTEAADGRLVTLTGPGGCGKTRLALEVAAHLQARHSHRFPDGIFVVRLSPLHTDTCVLPLIASTLKIGETADIPLLQQLKTFLGRCHMLLVLDGCEHVVEAAAQLVELLSAAPGLRILVTSRLCLRVYGEHEFPVLPLPLPADSTAAQFESIATCPAIALFIDRSRAVNPHFTLTRENAAQVAEICIRLDGLPLTIELAAARSKLLSPQAILARLSGAAWARLSFLADRAQWTGGTLVNHHQTLRATLDWSYQLLAPAEQDLFAQLAVFAGNIPLEAATAVCSASAALDVVTDLEGLLDHSLLYQLESEGETQFRLLGTIREYALERLAEHPEVEAVRHRYAQYYLQIAESAEPKFYGFEQKATVDRLESELDNLRAVLHWAIEHDEAQTGLSLAAALYRFWRRGHICEGLHWLERLLALPSAQSASAARIRALNATGFLAYAYTDVDGYQRSRSLFAESVALSTQLGECHQLAYALLGLANTLLLQGPRAQVTALHQQSLTICQKLEDRVGIALVLDGMSLAAGFYGDLAAGEQYVTQSVAIAQELGDWWSAESTLAMFASTVYTAQHDCGLARKLFRQCATVAEETDDPIWLGYTLANLADLALVEENYAEAEPLAHRALTLIQDTGEPWQPPRLLRMLGQVALQQGDPVRAKALHAESASRNRELGDTRGLIACVVGLAGVAAAQHQLDGAVRALAAAQRALEELNAELLPADRAAYQRTLAVAQHGLAPQQFTVAWASGKQLALDHAMQLALLN